jgi:hypothetical protein
MGHIQYLARKRKTARFFGTECQLADLSHGAIERSRLQEENNVLRAEMKLMRESLSNSLHGQLATAIKLAELLEREPALVAAIERAEAAHRYTIQALDVAQIQIDYLQDIIKGHGSAEERRLAEMGSRASRSIAALAEVDSE